MPLCLTLTNGMVHHAALLRPDARPAPMPPRMFYRGKITGVVKGRSNQAGGSSKSATNGDSPFGPASQVRANVAASSVGSDMDAVVLIESDQTLRALWGLLALTPIGALNSAWSTSQTARLKNIEILELKAELPQQALLPPQSHHRRTLRWSRRRRSGRHRSGWCGCRGASRRR